MVAAAVAALPSPGGLLYPAVGPWAPGPLGPLVLWPCCLSCYSHGSQGTDKEFDACWVTYFIKPDIDAWELCKGMNMLVGCDLVPEPKVIDNALLTCRWLNFCYCSLHPADC
ncbi:cytochrome c oxidase subunit 5A, mitochondrial-like [Leopardus geoffroyi]|uniref:cytochrome c oxidase subunit 5A, mitochondrial-like n=1 Tax=Leopardus geoffroyi TaxID=46844 RepID=UPI001E260869|nr:cytochrome c oxidase subunit 5A, mitochondrial-like [Leopardus geoffroyi]